MAEVAGLVMGGITFSALFDNIVTCFERLHLAREFGNSYTRYQTQLDVLELRLSRWRDAVTRLSATKAIVFTAQETDLVQDILTDIEDLFKKAEKKSKRLKHGTVPSEPDTASTTSEQSDESRRLSKAVKKLCLKRCGITKYRSNQTKWAVFLENEFKRLLEDLTRQVEDLEKIVPPQNIAALEQTLAAMRMEDAQELVTQENLEPSDITVIEESAEQVDPAFVEPVKDAVPQFPGSAHEYRRNQLDRSAKAIFGDHVATGYNGPVSNAKHVYEDNFVGGESKVVFGNSYGGKGFWDD